jgi:hypothetical protein
LNARFEDLTNPYGKCQESHHRCDWRYSWRSPAPGNSGLIDLVRDWGGKRKHYPGCGSRPQLLNVAMVNGIFCNSFDSAAGVIVDGKRYLLIPAARLSLLPYHGESTRASGRD